MPIIKDLSCQKFSRWTVIKLLPKRKNCSNSYWLCRCDCGKESNVNGTSLINGESKSCGCLRNELMSILRTTHGLTNVPEYYSWASMKTRCLNPNSPNYHLYGGRGIKICEEWIDSFEKFYEDMGSRPEGTTLDRKNVNGNYEKSNCKWSTLKEQSKNRRNSILIRIGKDVFSLRELSEKLGVKYNTMVSRYREGRRGKSLLRPTMVWYRNTPEIKEAKIKARKRFEWAVFTGKIKRPEYCQYPGCKHKKPHAHHHKGYLGDNLFDVQWFCRKHHILIEHENLLKTNSTMVM